MAESEIINKLVELQGTNFRVLDVEVNKEDIVWHIDHKKRAVYKCPTCFKNHKYASLLSC